MTLVTALPSASEDLAVGRVLQVNVSRGGIPKLPVERAWVGRFGVDGDAHREDTVHGGPHRAVCLFGIEAIERLQAEGHPVEPGSVGENLTTAGVEWSTLPVGTRARIGESLVLEVASPASPCATQRPNFLGGRFGRMSIKAHPSDSRMYGRVLAEGEVRPGDTVVVLPPAPDSEARAHQLLDRIDAVDGESSLRLWRAVRAGGWPISIIDDGELKAAGSPRLAGPAFNHCSGLRTLPHKLPRVLDLFRATGNDGWLPMHEPPWHGAEPDFRLSILAAASDAIAREASPRGFVVRPLGEDEGDRWVAVLAGSEGGVGDGWSDLIPHLLRTPKVHALVAEVEGQPAGVGALHVHRGVGFLRAAIVIPSARGRGIHGSLIGARAALARDVGCELISLHAEPGSVSERNALRLGFRKIAERDVYRFDPRRAAVG